MEKLHLKPDLENSYGLTGGLAAAEPVRAARLENRPSRGLPINWRASCRVGNRCFVPAVIFWMILIGVNPSAAAEDGAFAGIITDIDNNCAGQIIEAGTSETLPLYADADKRRPLASGDQLHCTGAGKIQIQGGQNPNSPIVVANAWVRVGRSEILNLIVRDLDPAVTRGDGGEPIYSPPSGGAARASDLVVRWNPWPGIDRVTISVRSKATQEKFCCDGSFDGKKGSLESPELRKALIPLRNGTPDARRLLLNIRSSVLRDFLIEFSLLSATEEAELDRDLTHWDGKNALLYHLGRAHAFSNYQLFARAAEESEAGLALAPESPYLLALAIAAEHRTGNLSPLEELNHRLEVAQGKTPKP